MSQIKLHLDVTEGSLDLECSGEDFEAVMTRVEGMMKNLANVPRRKPVAAVEGFSENEDTAEADGPGTVDKPAKKPKRRKGGGHSANWQVVDNLLDDDQRGKLKQFFIEKAPSNQNDQVAVLAFKLEQLTGRPAFDGNELHTAFQAVGEKTPANLSGVLGNMAGKDMGKVVDKKWTPNFKSKDRVNHDLPLAVKK